MSTTLSSATSPITIGRSRLETATAWLTGLSSVAILFSIAASQILLGAALACLLLSRKQLDFPARLRAPLLAFVGWTLLALAFSDAPASGLSQVKKLFVFFVLLLVCNAFQNQLQIWHTVQGVLLAGLFAAIYGLSQFGRDYISFLRRGVSFYDNYVVHQITGFMGHWMTFGGQMMMVILVLLSILYFADDLQWRRWLWPAIAVLSLALLAAFTRGIWLGTLAGATFLVGSYRRWMVGLIPAAVLLLYLLSPSWLQRRDESIFQPEQDSSSMARLVMIRTGANMIMAHPVFGLGLERVGPEFDRYKPVGIVLPPAWYGHLHDTYLQIAAERGIPCLIILLWFFFEVFRDNLPRTRSPVLKARALSYAAIAATIGLMVSGLFEYNIGDSEVFMLYLFVISIPYAWARLEFSPSGTTASGATERPIPSRLVPNLS